jgi:acylphosphatase
VASPHEANDRRAARAERWLVTGRVQGVGFRWFVRQAATARGVRGDVRNLPDGAVEVRAAGAPAALERLLDEVRRGPGGARVERVVTSEWDASDVGASFEIRR